MLLALQIIIVAGAIALGARLGSVGIGFAGGIGVVLLGLIGTPVTREDIPFDVIGIIMAVIAAIAALQRAGGMDYLVHIAERILRKNPKRITLLAPIVTYFMTLLAGTGHTAFSVLPVIVEVSKETGIKPTRPLSVAVVSSQIAITASPISAAVVFVASILEPMGVDYLTLLAIVIPTTFAAVLVSAIIAQLFTSRLEDDPIYQDRLAKGLVAPPKGMQDYTAPRGAKLSLILFVVSIVLVMVYSTLISDQVGLIAEPTLPRNEAIMSIMLGVAAIIVIACRIPAMEVPATSVFRSGMAACVCVMGVAWLGTTFVNANIDAITESSGDLLSSQPWLLAVVLFFAAALLYSQAATARAMLPAAVAVGVSPLGIIAAFAAVSALFVLPTYPTLLAAVEMDDTGSTRLGKYVFNHPFILPGIGMIVLAVAFGFLWGGILV